MRKRNPPPSTKRGGPAYRQLWRLVDGEVRDAFLSHPDYLPAPEHELRIRNSITKRVVGKVLGWASERGSGSFPRKVGD